MFYLHLNLIFKSPAHKPLYLLKQGDINTPSAGSSEKEHNWNICKVTDWVIKAFLSEGQCQNSGMQHDDWAFCADWSEQNTALVFVIDIKALWEEIF